MTFYYFLGALVYLALYLSMIHYPFNFQHFNIVTWQTVLNLHA